MATVQMACGRDFAVKPGERQIPRRLSPVFTRLPERDSVQALIVEELRRLHEGVLARYGVRLSEFEAWKKRQRISR